MRKHALIVLACLGVVSLGQARADDEAAWRPSWSGFSVGVGVGAGMMSTEVDVQATRKDELGVFVPPGAVVPDLEVLDGALGDALGNLVIGAPVVGPVLGGGLIGTLPGVIGGLPVVGDIVENGINIPLLGFFQTAGLNLDDAGDVGFFGTVQLAYDHQVSDRVVVGAFVDADFASDIEAKFDATGSTDLAVLPVLLGGLDIPISASSIKGNVEQDWGFSVGGRVGWLATPTTLFYALAAYTHVELDDPRITVQFANTFDVLADILPGLLAAGGPIEAKFSDSLDGYTIGAGVETQLSRSVSLKFEYRFTDLEETTAKVSRTDYAEPIAGLISLRRVQDEVEAKLDPDIHSVRAVLSYKFNRDEPPPYEPLK